MLSSECNRPRQFHSRRQKFGGDFLLRLSVALLFALIAQRYVLPAHVFDVGRLMSVLFSTVLLLIGTYFWVSRAFNIQSCIIWTAVILLTIFSLISSLLATGEFELDDYFVSPLLGAATFTLSYIEVKRYGSTRFFLCLILLFCVPLLVGGWQLFTRQYFVFVDYSGVEVSQAIVSVFVHPNVFGVVSLTTFVTAAYLLQGNLSLSVRAFSFLMVLGSMLGVFVAKGRASIVGLFVFIYLLVFMRYRVIRWLSFASLPVLYLTLPFILKADFIDNDKGITSLLWRFRTWDLVLANWQSENWFIGNGSGWIENILFVLQLGVLQVHNDYILLAMQSGGLAALIYFSGFVLLPISMAFDGAAKINSAVQFLVAFNVAVLFVSITENVFLDITVRLTMWSLIGGLTGVAFHERARRVQARSAS